MSATTTPPAIELRGGWNGNPWIFKGMVKSRGRIQAGALVEVRDRRGATVGWGLFNPHTPVACRVLSTDRLAPDPGWISRKLERARDLRRQLLPGESAYRLVHGEGDGLPGLIIDVFEGVVVIEPVAAGWLYLADWVVDALKAMYPDHVVTVRPDERSSQREKVDFRPLGENYPAPESTVAREQGVTFRVNLTTGHKTGFFLDQRANRRAVADLARGRELIDLCCYTGGFSLTAARAGARVVAAVDLDEKALVVAKENARDNGLDVRFEHADAFNWMRQAQEQKTRADIVVLDPPKLVAGKKHLEKGLKAYADLNRLALGVVRRGGYLLTCSCSGAVREHTFLEILNEAATRARKQVQVVRLTGADVDHPVDTRFPEGRYLKAILARVT